jgi:tetratricopeptide (TPR) repeat protein
VARPKKAKHRDEPESIAHTLDEIESTGDHLTEWIISNPTPILAGIAAIVVLAAGYGVVTSNQEGDLEAATEALGAAQADYRRAMGASPDDVVVAEPANPETALRVREEYLARFDEVASEYPGTAGAALAGLEAGLLEQALGKDEAAVETWREAAADLGPGSTLTALIELRVAEAHENDGRWVDAGEAFERAADVESFPLRLTARAEAARCYAEGGDVDRALATYARVKSEDPEVFLPEHLDFRLRELEALQRIN